MKLYGPYTRKDGRKHIVWYDRATGVRVTQSYPRYLMEQHLGRQLEEWETVDHINEDYTDDRIENLQLLTIEENAAKSASFKPSEELYEFNCPVCGKLTAKKMRNVKANKKKGCAGPFCGKKCAREYQLNN